jgi:hypothetical protein
VSEVLGGFVAAGSEPPSREEFARFSSQLIATGGFLRAAVWAPRSPAGPGRAGTLADGADRYAVRYRTPEPSDQAVYRENIAASFGGDAENPFTAVARLHEPDRPVDEGEREVRTAGGGTRFWALRSSPVGIGADGRRLALGMAADLTERRDAEARLQPLMREADHRAKNALAVGQAVVHLSKADADHPATFVSTVERRIQAIARTNSLLAEGRWSGVPLDRLACDELAASSGAAGIDVAGPPVPIGPEAAQTVSIVLHELATNALTYGALSDPRGGLSIR